jgi:hypothetical protein
MKRTTPARFAPGSESSGIRHSHHASSVVASSAVSVRHGVSGRPVQATVPAAAAVARNLRRFRLFSPVSTHHIVYWHLRQSSTAANPNSLPVWPGASAGPFGPFPLISTEPRMKRAIQPWGTNSRSRSRLGCGRSRDRRRWYCSFWNLLRVIPHFYDVESFGRKVHPLWVGDFALTLLSKSSTWHNCGISRHNSDIRVRNSNCIHPSGTEGGALLESRLRCCCHRTL